MCMYFDVLRHPFFDLVFLFVTYTQKSRLNGFVRVELVRVESVDFAVVRTSVRPTSYKVQTVESSFHPSALGIIK